MLGELPLEIEMAGGKGDTHLQFIPTVELGY